MGNCHAGSPRVLELNMKWEIVMLGVLVYWKLNMKWEIVILGVLVYGTEHEVGNCHAGSPRVLELNMKWETSCSVPYTRTPSMTISHFMFSSNTRGLPA